MLFTSWSTQSTYYVTPTPDTACPGEPCHTLSQYVTEQYFENSTRNIRMEFLPGNHTLKKTIALANLTQLTLHGDSSSFPEVTSRIVVSVCDPQTRPGFVFAGNTELHISVLAFISGVCGGGITILESESDIILYSIFQNIPLHLNTNILIVLTRNTFQNTERGSQALYARHSTLNLTENTFQNSSGGALYVEDSTLNLTGNTFQENSARLGGALLVTESTLRLTGNVFQDNSARLGGALFITNSTLSITRNVLQDNSAVVGGTFFTYNSTVNLTGNIFKDNEGGGGGAFNAKYSTLNLIGNTFQDNSATSDGGVLSTMGSTLNLTGNTFQNNSAAMGGVLFVTETMYTLSLTGNKFQDNSADRWGGALYVEDGALNLTRNIFLDNSAHHGGALRVEYGTVSLKGNVFHSNSAIGSGGSLFLTGASMAAFTDTIFTNNTAYSGGAIIAQTSNVRLYGNIVVANNTAQYGGGINIVDSQLEHVGSVFTVQKNTASYGGGLYVHNTNISGSATFNGNSATGGGGGIYASRSTFYFMGNTTFMENSAIDGGGLLLSDDSKFYLQQNTHLYFTSNSAKCNGGAIKIKETNPITYCTETYASDCFFQIQSLATVSEIKFKIVTLANLNATIHFDNNSAVEAGADVHGGSVNNCKLERHYCPYGHCPTGTSGKVFDDISISENTLDISSDPLRICTCRNNQTDCCGYYHPEPVYPGGTVEVPVIAQGQRNGSTTAKIQVIDTPDFNIIFPKIETIQNINKDCTTLKYTIQSSAEHSTQEIILYAEGPCLPETKPSQKILNTLRVFTDILDCPPGFRLSQIQPICICTDRLQQFTNTCRVDDKTVLRAPDAEFWVGYDNLSKGLILHPHCPFDYCTTEEIYLVVDNSDKQCNYNRSSLLCGKCSQNLSLALGSPSCLQCSNSYIALLVVFVFAGIALVFLLLVLRLTVAAGTINGLIFYANVVAVNSAIFFQPQDFNVSTVLIATKVLTVFVAWLNLDLGVETCFYNGMDAYVKTWLQFAFPLYIWALVGMIILGSYYSGRVAKVFGSNPIAVLATLFLLSYAKLLRTVFAALSFTFLEYPNNSQIAVWLYDGNIRYLSGKHISLFTAAVVCLIFLFFPYTILLIFIQWLQTKSIFSWINGRYFRPFLDAYHAPYTDQHRYWTGLMLLARFFLFLISAVNALGDPSVNLLAILSNTTAILTLFAILGGRIYKTWCLSLLEISFILNLAILSAASYHVRLTGGNQNATTLTSVGVAFAIFAGIVIFHSVQQLKCTRLWRRVCLRHNYVRVPLTDVDSGPEDPPDAVFVSGSAPTQTVVDIREYELREPCMATN